MGCGLGLEVGLGLGLGVGLGLGLGVGLGPSCMVWHLLPAPEASAVVTFITLRRLGSEMREAK